VVGRRVEEAMTTPHSGRGNTDAVKPNPPPSGPEAGELAYAQALGARLRRVRHQRGLSLQEVDRLSSHEFKASVLGAYERGERSISVPRLQRLAVLYDVALDGLLPLVERRTVGGDSGSDDGSAALEAQLRSASGPERDLILRYVRMVQAKRRGPSSSSMAIRSEDVRAIELLLGTSET
jgi:transcriptional regulator with XRE-family HTH domain